MGIRGRNRRTLHVVATLLLALAFASTASATEHTDPLAAPEPSPLAAAFADPSNLLVRQAPWLPPEAVVGGSLMLKTGVLPRSLDFLTNTDASTSLYRSLITMSLIERHRDQPLQHAAGLAYSLRSSADGLVFVLELRQDIWWHEPAVDLDDDRYQWLAERHRVTAHDVVFMMDLMLDPTVSDTAPLRGHFSHLASYRAIDDDTLELVWTEARPSNVSLLLELFPLPEFLYAFDEDGRSIPPFEVGRRLSEHWYGLRALGCGPYRFVGLEPGVGLVLERNPDHPLGGNAFQVIAFRHLWDQRSWPRALAQGLIDLTELQPAEYRTWILEGAPDSPLRGESVQTGAFWTHSYFYLGWNADRPMFADRRVRLALSHAFDADRFLRDIFLGLGQRTSGPMPSTSTPFYDPTVRPVPFDLQRAARLLERAGWRDTDGNGVRDKRIDGVLVELQFDLLSYPSAELREVGRLYAQDLAGIGVSMTPRPSDWGSLLDAVDSGRFDAATLAWASSPEVDFFQIWHSSQADIAGSSNRVGFRNPDADRLIERMRETGDLRARTRLARRFHRLIAREQPYTFFYTRKRVVVWRSQLRNVEFQQSRPYMNPRAWYFEDGVEMPAEEQ